MPSKTEIANRALQLLGDEPVLDISDTNKRAKACNRAYDPVRRDELRDHPWNFALRRQVLAPDVVAPAFGAKHQFSFPEGCLRVLRPRRGCDWKIEGNKILTDDGPALNLRFVYDEQDPSMFDAAFTEAIAASIAKAICENITGSSTKLADAERAYTAAIAEARRVNAFERGEQELPVDDWLLARY